MNEDLPDVSDYEKQYAKLLKELSDISKLEDPMSKQCQEFEKLEKIIADGHIGPQPKSILLTAAASLYKTHSGSARGDTPPLWAEGAKPCRAYLRRKAATISMNCAFVGGCDNGWPAIRSSKLWSGCLQHVCTRIRRFLSTQLVVVWKYCAVWL